MAMNAKENTGTSKKSMSVTAHIVELRRLLLYSAAAILICSVVCYTFFNEEILHIFNGPLEKLQVDLVYIGVAEAFRMQMKLAFLAGIIVAMPVVLFLLWRFIAPGLFPKEKRAVFIFFPIALLLFSGGILFAYFVVYQYALTFFLITTSGGLSPMLSVNQYVNFMYGFLLPFGFAFELPMVIYLLSRFGVISAGTLRKNRKYVFFIIVVLSAVITPADVLSMILLAVPLDLLYEISILIAVMVEKGRGEGRILPTKENH